MKNFLLIFLPFLIFAVLIAIYFIRNYIPVKIPYTFVNNYTNEPIENIKLLVWNVHKENNEALFLTEYQGLLRDNDCNFVLLQEYVYSITKISKNKYNYAFGPNLFQANSKAFSGIANLSMANIIDSQAMLSKNLEPILNTPKIALFTYYALNDKYNLLLINIHAINFRINMAPFEVQIRTIVEKANKHHGPIVFAGDFNTWNKKRLQIVNGLMEDLNMSKIYFKAHDNIKSVFGNPLDHVYYTPKYLSPILRKVISNLSSSDHSALFVEFKYNLAN